MIRGGRRGLGRGVQGEVVHHRLGKSREQDSSQLGGLRITSFGSLHIYTLESRRFFINIYGTKPEGRLSKQGYTPTIADIELYY